MAEQPPVRHGPDPQPPDPWTRLRAATPARIGLGQVGDAQPTRAVLAFQAAHALARDAVHARLDAAALAAALADPPAIRVRSLAPDRPTYLRRPDLGRRLDPACLPSLPKGDHDLALIVVDGLSATGIAAHAPALVAAIMARLPRDLGLAPLVVAEEGRVALGDEIAEALGARAVVVIIGERPGLTVPDSVGAYLTYAPKRGTRDAERNCISNIHRNGGLSYAAAADKIVWLAGEMLRRRLSGVALKDDQLVSLAGSAS
ncbi:ethanolamine ammonia-lyase subunit EutC [Chelatococcus daeguensis]|uniref:ethanolamine ammonia-lyase subunit EutC n=1 Tax=Chelatococcus daeguensis TaxID=444444 RepID=UPI0007AC07CB|nr:ethanolamine ammonia-lyase subunit EutC [Chelatococcus daeguensis]KZE28990.1 ethanolamine ammonia-lyase [Chelatococcus daeguensis]MBM3083683.1 ethanolamine ammonia-lyase subunit EutC [Chelatococcus daeguensis]